MTQQCSLLVEGEGARRAHGAAGGEETEKAEGEKGKINTASALFSPAWQREGIYCGGMMIYVRGGKAVRVRRGRRCAPIMINAPLHPGNNPASTLSGYHHAHHPILPPSFTTTSLLLPLPSLTEDLYLSFQTAVPTSLLYMQSSVCMYYR